MSEPVEQRRGGRRRLIVVAAVVAALVAAGVVIWTNRATEEPHDARPSRPKPTLEPLRLGDQPLWTSEAVTHQFRTDWVRTGDDVLLASHGDVATLVDTTTGASRWTFSDRQDLTGDDAGVSNLGSVTPSLVGAGADLGVITGWDYQTAVCAAGREECGDAAAGDAQGVALLSGVDGHVLWLTTVLGPDTPTGLHGPALVIPVVTDDVAVVAVAADRGDQQAAPPVRTLGIDVHTGATLWETTGGMWPSAAAGDVLLGEQEEPAKTKPDDKLLDKTVVATDLRSGKELWRGARGLGRSQLVVAAKDVVLVKGSTEDEPDVPLHRVLSARSGWPVAELPSGTGAGMGGVMECATDDSTVIACGYDDDRNRPTVAVYRLTDRTVATFPVDFPAKVEHVFAGRIELSGAKQGTVTMDAVGNTIDKGLRLPGRLVDLTEDRAVFLTEDSDPTLEVYPVVSG